jgi:DNA-directed RNA polymerase subunit RPC12/RpoP
MSRITSYFVSTKNKKYGYDIQTKKYYCIECGKELRDTKQLCDKKKCGSKFIFRVK